MASNKQVKVVLVGDGAVGKTCTIVSYATDKFPDAYTPTVFDNYSVTVDLPVDGQIERVELGLFDTAGQEDYDRVRSIVYPNTDVFIVCFSVVSPDSFDNVEYKWVPELRESSKDAQILLVGTQSDLRDNQRTLDDLQRVKKKPVPKSDAESLVKKLKLQGYRECSAFTQDGLKHVFDEALIIGLDPPKESPKRFCGCVIM